MKRWNQRPFEIRNLFNPAFCGLVMFRALDGYEKKDARGMPFSLSLLVLPLCLHKDTREVIASNPRTYLIKMVEMDQKIKVGFADRATQMLPYTFEGYGLLMERGCITVADDGRIQSTPDTVRKTFSGTTETRDCQKVARIIGKEFARIADRATIYATFGIRP